MAVFKPQPTKCHMTLHNYGSHLTNEKDIPAALWSRDGYSNIAVPGANANGNSYGLYIRPWVLASDGDIRGGGPPFKNAALCCDVGIPKGKRGAKINGAPAGVGERSC